MKRVSLVKQQEQLTPKDIKELRAEIDQGINDADNGRFVEFTAEEIIAEGRTTIAKRSRRFHNARKLRRNFKQQ